MKFSEFDQQMRCYEEALDQQIPPGIWPVVRIDGRGFTQKAKREQWQRPFDESFHRFMAETAKSLMTCGVQAIYAYIESDEISLLCHKQDNSFSRKIRKWLSVLAGEASAAFTFHSGQPAVFDARIAMLPSHEVCQDYFRWRQADAHRNALQTYCYWTLRQDNYSRQQATKLANQRTLEQKIALLWQYSINYKQIPLWQRYGSGIYWQEVTKEGWNPVKQQKTVTKRRELTLDQQLPTGEKYGEFILERLQNEER